MLEALSFLYPGSWQDPVAAHALAVRMLNRLPGGSQWRNDDKAVIFQTDIESLMAAVDFSALSCGHIVDICASPATVAHICNVLGGLRLVSNPLQEPDCQSSESEDDDEPYLHWPTHWYDPLQPYGYANLLHYCDVSAIIATPASRELAYLVVPLAALHAPLACCLVEASFLEPTYLGVPLAPVRQWLSDLEDSGRVSIVPCLYWSRVWLLIFDSPERKAAWSLSTFSFPH